MKSLCMATLDKAFALLRQHQLFARSSKYIFGQLKIEFLGDLIRDYNKVDSMSQWPTPTTL